MANTQILDEVRRLAQDTLRPYGAKLYLFGSWATGRPSRVSDIDLAVEAQPSLPTGVLAVLRERLEESHIPYRVEVIDLSVTDPAFREAILRHGIPWND